MQGKIVKKLISLSMVMFIFLFSWNKSAAQHHKILNVIPVPAKIEFKKGQFTIDQNAKVVVLSDDREISNIAIYYTEQVKILNNLQLPVINTTNPVRHSIILKIENNTGKMEAYHLSVDKKNILIVGSSPAGLFYGVQTLLQLMYPSSLNNKGIGIDCVEIHDEPAFSWRGMHLDVSRHFFQVAFVKKMIDMMAMHKMNIFHWHLTDDQGWRIEIKKYPRLTEIGSFRDDTIFGDTAAVGQNLSVSRYGGFYTQDEIKEVVKYAQSRYVTIIPEIEMPGHSLAALCAYPEYSCTGGPFKILNVGGITEDVFCPGKDETFQFLENILNEVIELFPGPYLHIGGDECPKTRWKTCPDCQKRIRDEGLKDELELQSYFVKRIEKFVASKGKKLIGWDEILEGGLPERAIVMSWRGINGGIEAARSGHDVIMTPVEYCYLDQYQAQQNEPLAQEGFLPLEKVYSFNPIPLTLPVQGRQHILGGQANVWTEYISTEEHAEYMIFPRLCAMAEVLWSPSGNKDYANFLIRLNSHLKRLQKLNINYHSIEPAAKDHKL